MNLNARPTGRLCKGKREMKYTTVIFDVDGTLLYTVKDLADATNYAIARRGYKTHSVEAITRMVGNGVNLLVARALPQGFDTPDYEAIMDDFRAYYAEHCFDNTRPYDGVPEMLRELRDRGVKMAIATNKYQAAAEELRQRFFADTVPVIVGDMEGRQRKPAPDSVFEALRALGAKAETAVYVGDTEVDMQTAKNAGLPCISAGWGYRTREELAALGAQVIADSPAEIPELIK